jgi:hypothetical protein
MKAQRLALGASSALLALLFAAFSAGGCVDTESVSVGGPDSSIGTAPVISGDFTTLAPDSNVSATLAITPSTLFWVDRGAGISDAIIGFSFGDDTPTELYTVSPDPTAAIEDAVADANNVYVTQLSAASGFSAFSSQVVAVPQDGSAPITLASGADTFTDLVALFRVATSGGASETVAGGGTEGILDPTIGGLFTNGGAVYWTEFDSNSGNTDLMSLATPEAKRTKLTDFAGPSVPLLAADSSNLFWVATSAEGISYVVDAPTGGGKTVIVASTQDAIEGLAADEANVYYLDQSADDLTESLIEAPIGGGLPTTLVSGIDPAAQGDPRHALALDDANVYFVQSGAVLSVPK